MGEGHRRVDADPAQPGRVDRGRLGRGPDGLRRPADRRTTTGVGVRGRTVVFGLHVCGGVPGHDARVVDRRARARPGGFRGCCPAPGAGQPADRGVPVGPLRAGVEPRLCPVGRALRHRGHPGQGETSPRQGSGRRERPVRRGAGRGGAPQAAVRRVGRVERGHLRRSRCHQRASVPEAGGLPADRVRTRREATVATAAAGPVRVGRAPQGQGRPELPRPGRQELLLRPFPVDRPIPGCAPHHEHRGGLRRDRAGRVPPPLPRGVGPVCDPAGPHARHPPQPTGRLDAGTIRAVGRHGGPEHPSGDRGDPGVPPDRRAVLPVLPGGDVAGHQARRHGPPGGHLHAGVGGHPRPSYTLIKKLWTGWTPPTQAPPAPSLGDAGYVRGSDYYGSRA